MRKSQRFNTSNLRMTHGVEEAVVKVRGFRAFLKASLSQHQSGVWGDLSDDQKGVNSKHTVLWCRVRSMFKVGGFPTILIITEGDHSATTVWLREEYEDRKFYG